ncbi:hypothetical protein BDN70DRAFT_458944 [Pholiota conissans]|uniref:Uncharacterized protein n=1 Tax=Pholiota conissans TaxID=109636 RepID=A0A9P5ZEZ6_9AGAR|nr:hypothetical protein BDN70DRAFT_458944 [Pholiota conissans]
MVDGPSDFCGDLVMEAHGGGSYAIRDDTANEDRGIWEGRTALRIATSPIIIIIITIIIMHNWMVCAFRLSGVQAPRNLGKAEICSAFIILTYHIARPEIGARTTHPASLSPRSQQ